MVLAEEDIITTEDYSLISPIASRRSPKGFIERPIERTKLRVLFEAARWAPSSRNEQPWRFIIGNRDENPAEFERMLATLSDSNKVWAKQAAVLIAVVVETTSSRDGRPNMLAEYDTGGAIAHLTLQAVSLGLQVHQMAGFKAARVQEIYNIPIDFVPVTVIALGYPDNNVLGKHQRERKELREFVFEGEWERTSTFIND